MQRRKRQYLDMQNNISFDFEKLIKITEVGSGEDLKKIVSGEPVEYKIKSANDEIRA